MSKLFFNTKQIKIMKKIYILGIILLTMVQVKAQCTYTTDEFTEDFETNGDCWKIETSASYKYIKDDASKAHTGTKSLYFYTFFSSDIVSYFISPEISTIDGKHYAEFFINTNANDAILEYGTMSNRDDISTFVKVGNTSESLVADNYVKIKTPVIPKKTDHKYFVIKVTTPSWHSTGYLDDFSWKKDTSSDVKIVKEKDIFDYYINSNNLNIDAKQTIQNVAIFNMNGQKIVYSVVNNNKAEVNIQNLPKGIYFVKMMIDNKIKSFKIIK